MKKEYHLTIARTDRIWLIVFVSVLLAWELIKPWLPAKEPLLIDPSLLPPLTADRDSSQTAFTKKEPRSGYKKNNYNSGYTPREENQFNEPPVPIHLQDATWKELRAIGFSSKVASNIERYIGAGGIIKDEDQLMKIYGMDSIQWEAVSPYIIFPPPKKDEPAFTNTIPTKPFVAQTVVDLNTASIETLDSLPGIGVVLAERIIKYRNSLGGFISVDQLGECYGLPPETLEKILPRLTIVTPHKPIQVNQVDLSQLYHPYLNKKMAGILRAYRSQHGQFQGVEDLKKVYPPDTTWCDKVLPYLVFD